jgi:hypothetical protein
VAGALTNLGELLANQPGREREAEELYRQAAATGDTAALRNLDELADDECEAAFAQDDLEYDAWKNAY